MTNLEELKNKKITMKEMFIFQELLEKIEITSIANDINQKIKSIALDNYTVEERTKLESIEKEKNTEKQLEYLKKLKESRTNRIGLEVEGTARRFVLKKLFKVEELFNDLLIVFTGNEEKNYDIETMTNIFNIMWINGLYKIALLYLKDDQGYSKKK